MHKSNEFDQLENRQREKVHAVKANFDDVDSWVIDSIFKEKDVYFIDYTYKKVRLFTLNT